MSVQNSHQISDIKVLLKIGANGNGIVSVEKTGTVGNVDTYTITFSDGTTTNFDVTNGTSIDTIEKTDTQGFVDTYTITLTDGSTTTFEVTNGRDTSADISAIVDLYGAKNLNAYPYTDTSQVDGGITWTDNGDGTISAGAGTASADTGFRCHVTGNAIRLPNGTYKVNGCPEGGSDSTWYIRWAGIVDDTSVAIDYIDTGAGQTITVNRTDNDGYLTCICYVKNGATVPTGGITFEPMIRDSRIEDDSWVEYAKTNKELTDDASDASAKMLKTSSTTSFDISANSSATFTLSTSSSFLIAISGRSVNVGSLFTTFTSGANSTYLNTLFKGSEISASATNNTITIANSSAYVIHVVFIGFNNNNTNNNTTVTVNS